MNINKYIFSEYDVRGNVEDDFPPEVVESLGKAFGTLIKRDGGQEVALSGDVRLTTPELIEQKLKSYTHHREYDLNPIGIDNIKKIIEKRE